MKVILLQDVAKLGRRFAIVEVPDGYGINKLIPKGLAKPATPENVKSVMARTSTALHSKEAAEVAFKDLMSALEGKEVVVKAPANGEGRFFQALKAEVIAEAVSLAAGSTVTANQIVIAEPIKATGACTVTIALGASHQPLHIIAQAA